MSQQYSSQVSARLAMLMLKEIAGRGGRVKLSYLKVYRTIRHWAGEEYASYILKRLIDGGLVELSSDYIILKASIQPGNSISLAREARVLIIKGGT